MRMQVLYESEVARVHDVWCDDDPEPVTEPTESTVAEVVLPRRGVYRRHLDGHEVLAEPTMAFFYNVGDVSHISHPCRCGDRNTTLTPGAAVLEDLGDGSGRLPATTVRLGGVHIAAHVRLHRGLRDRLATDEALVALLVDVVRPQSPARATPRQRRVAMSAVELLAARAAADLGLGEIASELGASPTCVSRAVTAAYDTSLTRIRTRLRVRHAVERIVGDGGDLAAIAAEVGFYDQSHMTNVIRQEVGETPRGLAT